MLVSMMKIEKEKTVGDTTTRVQLTITLDGDETVENTEALVAKYNNEMAKIDAMLNQ